MERRFNYVQLLLIYVNGLAFIENHVICAIGMDSAGKKHILGVVVGAGENGDATASFLDDLVERGIDL